VINVAKKNISYLLHFMLYHCLLLIMGVLAIADLAVQKIKSLLHLSLFFVDDLQLGDGSARNMEPYIRCGLMSQKLV
jgi:hypothetical protein